MPPAQFKRVYLMSPIDARYAAMLIVRRHACERFAAGLRRYVYVDMRFRLRLFDAAADCYYTMLVATVTL